jgi:hypothetical protein
MQTRFHFDVKGIITMIGGLLIGSLLMLVPIILSGSIAQLLTYLIPVLSALAMLWFAFTRGSYVTIDEKHVRGRFLFFPGKVTPLSEVTSIRARSTFLGLITEVFMTRHECDGTLVEVGLVSKESLSAGDFRRLLETIRAANPNIDIDPSLLNQNV